MRSGKVVAIGLVVVVSQVLVACGGTLNTSQTQTRTAEIIEASVTAQLAGTPIPTLVSPATTARTSIASATPTPAPTAAPQQTPQSQSTTLEVSWTELRAKIEPLGFTFTQLKPYNGMILYIASDTSGPGEIDGTARGPNEKLLNAGLQFKKPERQVRRDQLLIAFIKAAVPSWSDGPKWVMDNLKTTPQPIGTAASTLYRGLHITLGNDDILGLDLVVTGTTQ